MRSLIISLLALIYTNDVFSQLGFEEKMLSLEKKIFESKNDSIKNIFCLEKFNSSLKKQDYKRSYHELRRVRELFLSDSVTKSDFYWNATLISKLSNEPQYANIYYDAYLYYTNDSSESSLILGMLIKSDIDSSEFFEFKRKYDFTKNNDCFDCFDELFSFKLKRKWAYVFSSYILPGTGTLLTGDLYNGIGSLFTVSGFSYGIYQLTKSKLYYGAGIWGYLFLPRVYFGNIRLTVAKIKELEKKKKSKLVYSCEQKVKELLNNNPIDFRLNE